MQQNTEINIVELQQKIDAIYISVEKTRKYIFWAFVITVLAVVLPIIGLFFAIPSFISNLDQIKSLGL